MSPTLSNVSVDSVISHRVEVVAATDEGTEVLLFIQDLVAHFYTNDGIFTSTQPERLQWLFDVLTVLLDQVDLRTDTQRMVSMN